MARPAVFLDRDGTLNEEVRYLDRSDNLQLLPGAVQAVRLLNERGWRVVVVTNQSGVARGYFTENDLSVIHERLKRDLAQGGAYLDGIRYCPHHPDAGCLCRKPGVALFLDAAQQLDIDLAASYLVGDKLTDLLPARRLGARTVLVLTGYGDAELSAARTAGFEPDYVAAGLLEAAQWIGQTDDYGVEATPQANEIGVEKGS